MSAAAISRPYRLAAARDATPPLSSRPRLQGPGPRRRYRRQARCANRARRGSDHTAQAPASGCSPVARHRSTLPAARAADGGSAAESLRRRAVSLSRGRRARHRPCRRASSRGAGHPQRRTRLDGRANRRERRHRDRGDRVAEPAEHGLLAECAGLALVRDVRHAEITRSADRSSASVTSSTSTTRPIRIGRIHL